MTHPLFHNGFRPFFLGGALFAALAIPVWAAMFSGLLPVDHLYSPMDWHAHEMVFGFFGSILGGFLLTAIPSWTNRPALSGERLRLLFLVWLSGRVMMAVYVVGNPDLMPVAVGVAMVDLLYPVLLTVFAAQQVVHAKAIHNLPVVFMVGLFGVADLLFHLAPYVGAQRMIGPHLGLAVAGVLVALIGGRVIPNFTRNWLSMKSQVAAPVQRAKFDMGVVAVTAVALVSWIFAPQSAVVGVLLALASLGAMIRLAGWRGLHTFAEPLVLILHIGYVWLVAALAALSVSALVPNLLPGVTALHVLTTGAMGVMVVAIMTRATRGHTGRPLHADGTTKLIYVLVNVGAVLRVAAPFLPMDYASAAGLGGILWAAAFLVFAVTYGPWLVKPRL